MLFPHDVNSENYSYKIERNDLLQTVIIHTNLVKLGRVFQRKIKRFLPKPLNDTKILVTSIRHDL